MLMSNLILVSSHSWSSIFIPWRILDSSFRQRLLYSTAYYAPRSAPFNLPPPLADTFFLSSYHVGLLYISKTTRLSFSSWITPTQNCGAQHKEVSERWRDDPDVIRARLTTVTCATVLCCVGLLGAWVPGSELVLRCWLLCLANLGTHALSKLTISQHFTHDKHR